MYLSSFEITWNQHEIFTWNSCEYYFHTNFTWKNNKWISRKAKLPVSCITILMYFKHFNKKKLICCCQIHFLMINLTSKSDLYIENETNKTQTNNQLTYLAGKTCEGNINTNENVKLHLFIAQCTKWNKYVGMQWRNWPKVGFLRSNYPSITPVLHR